MSYPAALQRRLESAEGFLRQHNPAARRKAGLVYAEGARVAHEAVLGCWPVRRLVAEAGWLAAQPADHPLLAAAAARRLPMDVVGPRVLARLADCETPAPVGALVEVPPLPFVASADVAGWCVLDAIADPGNAGTLIRSAAAFGFAAVLTGEGVRPGNEKLVRSTAGICFGPGRLMQVLDREELARALAAAGATLVVLDAGGAASLDTISLPRGARPAVVVGNESHGPHALWRARGLTCSIPMEHGVESLNAGVAGSLALYRLRLLRQGSSTS